MIGLRQGVGRVEVLIKELNRADGMLKGEIETGGGLRWRGPDGHFHVILCLASDVLQLTHHECHQVGAHARRLGKGSGESTICFLLRLDGHIAKHRDARLSCDGYVEGRFGSRLINTREDLARMMALELRHKQFLLRTVVLIITGVETME